MVDQIVYLLRRCQNLGTSSRTPVQTIDKTINAVNRCEEVRKKDCEEREHETLLVSPLPSFLLVIIGYNKSIVLQQHMIVLKYYIPHIVAM